MFGKSQNSRAKREKLGGQMGMLGGLLTDFSGNTHGAFAAQQGVVQQRTQQAQSQQRQRQLLAEMKAAGVSPQMMLAAKLNPNAAGGALATNGTRQIKQHGNKLGVVGGNGHFQTFDMGASAADQNATLGHQVDMRGQDITKQNNLANQGLGQGKLDELIRSNQAGEGLTQFSNDTGRMNAVTNREKAQFAAANPTSDLGKNPLYMTDAEGNLQVGQLGNGQIVQAKTPEGMKLLSPYEKSMQMSQGRVSGKAVGDAAAGLPNAIAGARDTLDTLRMVRNHSGMADALGPIDSLKPPILQSKDAIGFNAAADQIQGQTFLQGYQQLKGAGVITDFEGGKAEDSLARLNRSQTPEQYKAALDDFQGIVARGMARQYERAGQPVPDDVAQIVENYGRRESGGNSALTPPKIGEVVDGWTYNGGDPADPASYSR